MIRKVFSRKESSQIYKLYKSDRENSLPQTLATKRTFCYTFLVPKTKKQLDIRRKRTYDKNKGSRTYIRPAQMEK